MTSEQWQSPRSEVMAQRAIGHAFADIRQARLREDALGEKPLRYRVEKWRSTLLRYPDDDEKRQVRFVAILDGWLKSRLPDDPAPDA